MFFIASSCVFSESACINVATMTSAGIWPSNRNNAPAVMLSCTVQPTQPQIPDDSGVQQTACLPCAAGCRQAGRQAGREGIGEAFLPRGLQLLDRGRCAASTSQPSRQRNVVFFFLVLFWCCFSFVCVLRLAPVPSFHLPLVSCSISCVSAVVTGIWLCLSQHAPLY